MAKQPLIYRYRFTPGKTIFQRPGENFKYDIDRGVYDTDTLHPELGTPGKVPIIEPSKLKRPEEPEKKIEPEKKPAVRRLRRGD